MSIENQRDQFELIYTAAARGEQDVPWERGGPHPVLVEWVTRRRALVVGCGLGPDAEYVAGLGFDTTAFDFSPTAIRLALRNQPDTRVDYVVADLLDPPVEWRRAFDLVVECITVQALPRKFRARAIGQVGEFVAPGGTLLAIALADVGQGADEGGPWPLTREDVESFATPELELVRLEQVEHQDVVRWRAELRRAADPVAVNDMRPQVGRPPRRRR